jgi:hypothetical protein
VARAAMQQIPKSKKFSRSASKTYRLHFLERVDVAKGFFFFKFGSFHVGDRQGM